MPILSKGYTFFTPDQVSPDKLNNLVDNATFASGAVDNSTTQLSGGAIIVKDGGVSPGKLSVGGPTWDTSGNLTVTGDVVASGGEVFIGAGAGSNPFGAGTTGFFALDADFSSQLMIGQSSTRALSLLWNYNSDPAAGSAVLATLFKSNSLTIQAKNIYLDSESLAFAVQVLSSGRVVVGGGVDDGVNALQTSTFGSTGNATIGGSLRTSNGSAAAPAHSFTDDTDCGAYRIGANNIGYAIGGTKVLDLSSSSAVLYNRTAVTTANSGNSGLLTVGSVYSAGNNHPAYLELHGNSDGGNYSAYITLYNDYTGNTGSAQIAASSYQLGFLVNGTTRMALNSNGANVTGSVGAGNIGFALNSGSTDGAYCGNDALVASRNNSAPFAIRRRSSDGIIGEFYRDTSVVGTISVTTTSTSYNTSSDRRLKENFRELSGSGRIVDALRPVVHDWKNGKKDCYGFIAQEVYEVFPQAVTKGDDDPEEITQPWQMDAGKLMPVVVAELKSLRERVSKLEAA